MSELSSDSLGQVPSGLLKARAQQEYARQNRESAEERWILDHLPLVRHVVNKVASHIPGQADLEDLISAGTVGLVRAAKAFDPTRDTEFKTYAYIRIRGAVLDELRSRSFVPSNVHNQIQAIRQAYQRLTADNGRPPSDEELASAMAMSSSELYQVLEEARRQHFLSIHGLNEDRPALGTFLPPSEGNSPVDEAERKEMLEQLAGAIRELSEKERLVILLYYERDLTMKEAAKVLGITESRVSQIHASAVFKLSMKLRTQT